MEELTKGTIINGRYKLKKHLGKGTFGEVWLTEDMGTRQEVAVKLYLSLDNRGCVEFLDEYRVAANLHHKNLLKTHEYNLWNGRPYLVLDYLSEGSAEKYIGHLQPGKVDELIIWRFIGDVSSGLAYLHSLEPDPIVHQDIKPANILLNYRGEFIITDFGISKKMRGTMRSQSLREGSKGVDGSRAYMAPELFQARGGSVLASDIWSLGASIFELAEGQLPFMGNGGYGLNIGFQMPVLSEGWSKNLEAIMHFCMVKEPWYRAKAIEVCKLAETVLSYFDTDVLRMIEDIKTSRGIPIGNSLNGEEAMKGESGSKSSRPDTVDYGIKSDVEELEGASTDSSTDKGKAVKWFALALFIIACFAVLAFVFLNNQDTDLELASKSKDRYQYFVNEITVYYNNIDKNDPDIDSLKMMMSYNDSLLFYESIFNRVIPEFYNRSANLSNSINSLRKTAAINYAELARSDLIINNKNNAMDNFKTSLFFWEDEKVKEELRILEEY